MIDNRPWLDFGYQFWRACSTQAPLHAISRDEKFGPDTMRLQRNVERNIERHEDIGARTRDDRFRNWGSSCTLCTVPDMETRLAFHLLAWPPSLILSTLKETSKRRDFFLDGPRG